MSCCSVIARWTFLILSFLIIELLSVTKEQPRDSGQKCQPSKQFHAKLAVACLIGFTFCARQAHVDHLVRPALQVRLEPT